MPIIRSSVLLLVVTLLSAPGFSQVGNQTAGLEESSGGAPDTRFNHYFCEVQIMCEDKAEPLQSIPIGNLPIEEVADQVGKSMATPEDFRVTCWRNTPGYSNPTAKRVVDWYRAKDGEPSDVIREYSPEESNNPPPISCLSDNPPTYQGDLGEIPSSI